MVQVQVTEGVLEGYLVYNERGGKYYSFKGIPFAEPPVGELRFKAPLPPKPWHGVRSANEFGPMCYQVPFFSQEQPQGSEDCLYLNVYTPEVTPKNPMPVIFWIHGGAFKSGSGNDDVYGPEFLVRHDVILVTFNYRLEVLGFLCLDTEDIPGNAGMKDQVAALRWVNKNITNFGGDPNNITIAGESAGAACVTYHLVSPMSEGLFRRAIAQSGTAACPWALTFEPRERALAAARQLGCYTENVRDLHEFFKSLPVEKLVQIKAPVTITEQIKQSSNVYFSVVSENNFGKNERFFYEDLYDMQTRVNSAVEIILGYNEDEGFMNLASFKNNFDKLIYLVNHYTDYMVPDHIVNNCTISQQLEVGGKFRKYYLKNGNLSMNNLELLAKYNSFAKFVYGTIQWAKICCKANNTVYLYKFTCKSERNFLVNTLGLSNVAGDRIITCHADDLAYLFPANGFCKKLDENSKANRMVDHMTKLWSNFARYGNPTPDSNLNIKWKPYTLEKEDYLIIGEELLASTEPEKQEIEFWDDIFREYLPQFLVS